MDKNTMKQNKNLRYLLMLLLVFILFVISTLFDETLGMLMFGVLILYSIIGNDSYMAEHSTYEEILQPKRELLNYDRDPVQERMTDNKIEGHTVYKKILIIAGLFVLMYIVGNLTMIGGMLLFGALVFYTFLA